MPRLSPDTELLENSLRKCCLALGVHAPPRWGLARILWRMDVQGASVRLFEGTWYATLGSVTVTCDARALAPCAVRQPDPMEATQLELHLEPVTYAIDIQAQSPFGYQDE